MAATGALLFGGAGVANATTVGAPSASETTILADNNNDNQQNSDKTGLWGLAGLLGLLGLTGLKRRNDDVQAGAGNVRPGAGTVTNTPRNDAV